MKVKKPKPFKIKRSKFSMSFALLLVIFVIFYGIGWSIASIQTGIYEQKRAKRLAEAVDFCENLFEESTVMRENVTDENLKDCEERLSELEQESEQIEKLKVEVSDAYKYLDWNKLADEWFDENGVVKESLDEQSLARVHESAEALTDAYKEVIAERRNLLQSEYDKMRHSENLVNGLFTSIDRADVRTDASRGEYDDARNHVNELGQEGLKNSLNEALNRVLPVIEEQERIARERAEAARRAREEEQRRIRESWHNLDLSPWYINQLSNGLINGCEAASLLMAAKYKGYVRGANYRAFAAAIPITDNPNTGFFGAMDNNDGGDTHWIAPAPLAAFGRGQGINVTNMSGASLDQLDQEVANGNPVIIYLTYNFNSPRDYNNGVPRNLHVLVLSGFNSYTGEQVLYDPLPKYGNSHPTVSKNTVQWLYAASGYRALVVR